MARLPACPATRSLAAARTDQSNLEPWGATYTIEVQELSELSWPSRYGVLTAD
jgi:hypothetical protein